MSFCRRPLSFDYHIDAIHRLSEVNTRDVRIIIDAADDLGIDDDPADCPVDASDDEGSDLQLDNVSNDPFSEFPFMVGSDQDLVSCCCVYIFFHSVLELALPPTQLHMSHSHNLLETMARLSLRFHPR